jgi:hypothetical protein
VTLSSLCDASYRVQLELQPAAALLVFTGSHHGAACVALQTKKTLYFVICFVGISQITGEQGASLFLFVAR